MVDVLYYPVIITIWYMIPDGFAPAVLLCLLTEQGKRMPLIFFLALFFYSLL